MILDDPELVPIDATIENLGTPRGPALDALNAHLEGSEDDTKLIWVIAPLAAAGMYLLVRKKAAAAAPGAPAGASSSDPLTNAGQDPAPLTPVGADSQTPPPNNPIIRAGWSRADLSALANRIAARELYPRPELIQAIISVESSWNPNAINKGDSPPRDAVDDGDSIGLMQIKLLTARPFTPWATSIEALLDPETNITAGVRFLATLERKWGTEYGLAGVIQMYNLGETRFRNGERSSAYLGKVTKAIASYNLTGR